MADTAMENQTKTEGESRPYAPGWLDRYER
jgi:hypothetical protein